MHYFTYGPHIAAVENADQAAKYAAAGWHAVSRDEFTTAWRAKAAQRLDDLLNDAVVRAVRSGKMIERLPRGWARYSV